MKRFLFSLRNNLQLRLMLIGSLPLLLVTVLFTAHAIFSRQGEALQRVESFGIRTADYLANTLDFAFFALDEGVFASISADLQAVPGIRGVGFLDRNRQLFHSSAGFPVNGVGFSLEQPLGSGPLQVGDALLLERAILPRAWQVDDYASPPKPPEAATDEPLGWVVVALDLAEARQAQRAILVTSLGVGATVLGSALLVSLVLSRAVVAPIRRLTDTVARLQQGDLEARAGPTPHGELAQLAEGINHLGESVAHNRLALEQQVAQATGELHIALDNLQRNNRELEVAVQKAEAANHAKSDFLARMSHELRTPLTSIQGFVRLLENSLSEAADRSYCRIIDQAAISLMALIEDILEFARLQAEPQRSPPELLTLREPLEGAVNLLAPTAHDKGVEIYLHIDADIPEQLIGDARALRQIVNNLVGNAVKFTTSGHVLVQCRRPDPQHLDISVRDTGIGIAPEQQRQIFEAFQQADSGVARRFGGSGLGLAIARHHIDQLGGSIELHSHPGAGSEFRVRIPCQWPADIQTAPPGCQGRALVYDPDELGRDSTLQSIRRIYPDSCPLGSFDDLIDMIASQPVAALNFNWSLGEPEARQLASLRHVIDELRCPIAVQVPLNVLHGVIPDELLQGHPHVHWLGKPASFDSLRDVLCSASVSRSQPTADLSGIRVLVVEDNGFSRQLLGALLERTGCSYLDVADGRAAVEHCARQRFDVILMDLHMPEVAGVEALVQIQRSGARNADTPVIVLTADQMLDAGRELRMVRVEQILRKPYEEGQLFDALLTLTGRSGQPPADWFGSSAELPRELYFDEIDQLLSVVDASLTRRDSEAARDACHQLAGMVAVFRLGQIEEHTRLLQSLVRVSDWDRAGNMVIRLRLENRTQRYSHRHSSS